MMVSGLITGMVDRIIDQFHPISIILFGSQARADTNKSNNVNLVVVMNDVQNKHHTAIAIRQLLGDIPISMDIVVATPDEIDRRRFTAGSVIHEAYREGRVLYDHSNDVEESLRWLRLAIKDLDAASHLSKSLDVPRHVCWHSQQAAEKALKAALVLEHIRFPFVHDLDILRDLLPEGWMARDIQKDMSFFAEWAVVAKYAADVPQPTAEDAVEAESTARLILNSIRDDFKRRDIHV